jgi:hypothetical protein
MRDHPPSRARDERRRSSRSWVPAIGQHLIFGDGRYQAVEIPLIAEAMINLIYAHCVFATNWTLRPPKAIRRTARIIGILYPLGRTQQYFNSLLAARLLGDGRGSESLPL